MIKYTDVMESRWQRDFMDFSQISSHAFSLNFIQTLFIVFALALVEAQGDSGFIAKDREGSYLPAVIVMLLADMIFLADQVNAIFKKKLLVKLDFDKHLALMVLVTALGLAVLAMLILTDGKELVYE